MPFGVIITLICFSGAMLVFEPEITRGLKGDIYYVTSAEGEPIDMKELMETVKRLANVEQISLEEYSKLENSERKRLGL